VTRFQLPLLPPTNDPRVRWIEQHCIQASSGAVRYGVQFASYICGGPAAVSTPVPAPVQTPAPVSTKAP
jgi:hypothetical protein